MDGGQSLCAFRSLPTKAGYEALKLLLKHHVGPHLVSKGFKRSGLRFTRWPGRNCQLIKFLTDIQDEREDDQFTLYIGVFSKTLWYFENENRPAPGVPDQPACQWGGFLEEFLPRYRDRWFAISSEDQVPGLAREILKLLEDEVLPLLSTVETDKALRDYWLRGRSPGAGEVQRLSYLAFLSYRLGPRDDVKRLVDQLRAEAGGTPAGERYLKNLAALVER